MTIFLLTAHCLFQMTQKLETALSHYDHFPLIRSLFVPDDPETGDSSEPLWPCSLNRSLFVPDDPETGDSSEPLRPCSRPQLGQDIPPAGLMGLREMEVVLSQSKSSCGICRLPFGGSSVNKVIYLNFADKGNLCSAFTTVFDWRFILSTEIVHWTWQTRECRTHNQISGCTTVGQVLVA